MKSIYTKQSSKQKMEVYQSQIDTKDEVIQKLTQYCWCVLAAQLQSGKTITYLLTVFEMLRLNIVSVAAIISGNNEIILRQQIIDNIQQFKPIYKRYLDKNGIRCGRWVDLYEWVDETDKLVDNIASKIDVAFGHELKKFKLYDVSENPLYIWDESHYGQSENQEIDKFFRLRNIQANGANGADSNWKVISVSATPNAEMSDIHHLNQAKCIVRIKPGPRYLGIKKMMQNGQFQNFNDHKRDFPRILLRHRENKYNLIRATDKTQAWMITMATHYGFDCIKFDMSTSVDLDKLLSTEPSNKTLVFLKRKCCMGKQVIKNHIGFVMETTFSKTDTLLQGLPGRMCGYDSREDIMIYIFKYDKQKSGFDSYIALHDGNDTSIAARAMNIRKTEGKQLRPIIPVKMVLGLDPEHCDARGIIRQITESHISPLEDVGIFQTNSQQVWNDVIVPRVCQHINAYLKRPSERSPEEQILAAGCKFHLRGEVYDRALPEIEESWRQNKEQCAFGSGAGAGVSKNELIIWMKNNVCYLTMQYEDSNYEKVPKTTRKEIFCRSTTTGGAEFTFPPETRTQPYKLEEMIDALIEASRHLNVPVLSSNGYGNHILMTDQVFNHFKTVIEKWRPQTTITFKMVPGRRPVGVTDIRIASITWTKLRASL